MAVTHFFAGPALVNIQFAGGQALQNIGLNREAIPIQIQPQFLDVECDDFGGPDGVPSDVQMLGGIAQVQLSLTKFELAAIDKLLDGVSYEGGPGAGTFDEFGQFIRLGGKFFQLQLLSNYRAWLATHCFVRGGGVVGQGTRYSSYDMTIECHMHGSATRALYGISYPV